MKKSVIFSCFYLLNFYSIRSKNIEEKATFWPGQFFRTRFTKTYNLKYEKHHDTQFSRRGYKSQLVPAITLNRALRYMFKIGAGEGNIRNVDESMCYAYNTASKSWTV